MTPSGVSAPAVGVAGPELHRRRGLGLELAALVWSFPSGLLCASTAVCGGGVGTRHWALNAQVPPSYAAADPTADAEALAVSLGLPGAGVGMLTAVDVRTFWSALDGGVRADATVGVTHPLWAAATDDADDGAGVHTGPEAGTINVVVRVPVRLSEGALVNAVATATEAKAQALWEAGIDATGTPTDALCVMCAPEGAAHAYGGPRSLWGGRLARAVHGAIAAGLADEVGAGE